MTTRPAAPAAGRRPTERRRGPASLLIAFLTGVVLTAVAGVALLGFGIATVGDAEEALDAEATTTATAEPTASGDPTPADDPTAAGDPTPADGATHSPGTGDVPDSCVRASRHSLALSEALDQIAVGVRDQDARTVQEALDAVQDAEAEADGGAEQCLELAGEQPDTPAP